MNYNKEEFFDFMASIKHVTEPTFWELNKKAKEDVECGQYYMPLAHEQFLFYLEQALDIFPEAKTFLDVGSGVGDKVAIAEFLGLEATGLELSSTLINAFDEFKDLNILQQDITTFENYDDYDIIYLYNPIPVTAWFEDGKMKLDKEFATTQLVDKIMEQCQSETIIIAIGYYGDIPEGWTSYEVGKRPFGLKDDLLGNFHLSSDLIIENATSSKTR